MKRKTLLSPLPNSRVVKMSLGSCWLDESGIVFCIALGNQTLEHARENIAILTIYNDGKRKPLLLDFSNMQSQTREAREYYASDETNKAVSSVAVVTNTLIGNLIGNFFIGLNKSIFPIKLFTDITEAKQWLVPFVKE